MGVLKASGMEKLIKKKITSRKEKKRKEKGHLHPLLLITLNFYTLSFGFGWKPFQLGN